MTSLQLGEPFSDFIVTETSSTGTQEPKPSPFQMQ